MNFDIKENEIHVWKISLLDFSNDITFLTQSLSVEEIKKANIYKFLIDQQKFILGRGLLKYLIAKYLNVKIQNINIIYGSWGKPYLAQQNKLYFNISHSGNYVLYAFTQHYEIGIDLEYIDQNFDLDEMIKTIFSQSDLIYWDTLGEQDKVNNFFKYWVYKEAFLKARGKGWLGEEATLSFKEITELEQKSIFKEFLSEKNYLYFFNCFPEYASALYVKGPPLQTRFFSLSHVA